MPEKNLIKEFHVDRLKVEIYPGRTEMGRAAAHAVGERLRNAQRTKDDIRMVFAAAPSQNDFLAALSELPDIDWSKVTAFHMDEYLGLPPDAAQSFGRYLREHIFDKVSFKQVHFIYSQAADVAAECHRYASLLQEAPVDIVCMGIGENGHLAFNDPPVANFFDPEMVKVVELDEVCRQQQVNDGCFATLDEVPQKAITLTIPALLATEFISVVVPGPTKKDAVYRALYDAIDTACPASILRKHKQTILYLDTDSAARIEQ